MLLINNKYCKYYFSIISNAQKQNRTRSPDTFYENHHIYPKSLYPLYKKSEWNLVLLTPHEHWVCHRLLVKFIKCQTSKNKMFSSLVIMANKKYREVNGRTYDYIRRHINYSKTDETRRRMKKAQQARREDISRINKEQGTFRKLWETDAFRATVSAAVSKAQTSRLKDPDVLQLQVNNLNKKVTCKYCDKTMNIGNHNRWHGENCQEHFKRINK